MLIGLILV